ncbi:hypothetical protein ACCO45_008692 [Purpureocillium lilacinum]|uniref:Uncharacterized protein n=1 Tax=Purpureocillium lilacinum TaxID=33203 RepID=A0ACC4DP90_PURLI
MSKDKELRIYHELRDWPRPSYPFPDLVSPFIEDLADEYYEWIDADCQFESRSAREAHKRHRLTDIAARAFPSLTIDELRPIARFTAFLAILDDIMDHSDPNELNNVKRRILAILNGDEQTLPQPGFYRQIHAIRQECLDCSMPIHLFDEFVSSIVELMIGYAREKTYNAKNEPPLSLSISQFAGRPREAYAMQNICAYTRITATFQVRIIGYHNDFISLPKELSREGDVVNIVISIQRESGLELKDAYMKALGVHDADLAEFVQLQSELPDFGQWQQKAKDYVADLGTLVQGVYAWHVTNTGRYVPGAYVEPEDKVQLEATATEKNSPLSAYDAVGRLTAKATSTPFFARARSFLPFTHLFRLFWILAGLAILTTYL